MRTAATALACCSLLALTVQGAARLPEEEMEIDLDDAPRAVQEAFAEYAQGPIEEVEVELVDGRLVYEAEWTMDGVEYEVEVAEDGELLALEREIEVTDVPLAVIEAVGRAVPGGVPDDWSHTLVAVYDVEVESGGQLHTLRVLPTGEVQSHTSETGGDD